VRWEGVEIWGDRVGEYGARIVGREIFSKDTRGRRTLPLHGLGFWD
jgi:hypothetical protein